MNYEIKRCEEADAEYIDDKLVEFNLSQVPAEEGREFYLVYRKITDDNGNILGGCLAGCTPWNVGYIDELWADETCRKQGLGTALVSEVERVLKENGCYLVLLDTFDWQARGFYEKNGYTVVGTVEDCPIGHSRYYMKKNI